MTAPRACRSCGADLAVDVRWCTRCYAPITEYAARERLHDGFVGITQPDVRYSRWKAGPLSFGPVGRLLVTTLVLLMGPWTTISFFTLMYAPIWLGLSVTVLKQVWRREPVEADSPPSVTERFRERHPILGYRFKGSSVVIALSALLLVTGSILMIRADTAGRYALVVVCVMLALGAFIAWIADV